MRRSLGRLPLLGMALCVELVAASCGGKSSSSSVGVPTFQPGAGTYPSGQVVTIRAPSDNAQVFYTTDGSEPQNTSSVLSPNFTGGTQDVILLASTTIKAFATAGGKTSATESAKYTISPPASAPTVPSFPSGFTADSPVQLNGDATLSGNTLSLTNDASGQVGAAFFPYAVNISSFTTHFRFQITSSGAAATMADGITFTVQGLGAFALGSRGGGLGYGADPIFGGYISKIDHSVAVKFDTFEDSQVPGQTDANTTGVFTNGASPVLPADSLSPLDLHSGNVFDVEIVYASGTLTLTVTEESTPTKVFGPKSYAVDIPSNVGASTGYVGFTASTGSATSRQEILSWTFSN